jgi:hypothetical protein
MFPTLSIVILLFLMFGCASQPQFTPAQKEEGRHLQMLSAAAEKITVNTSDGISEVEAYKIADDYFINKNGNICGMVGIPKDEDTDWRVPIYEGYAGTYTKDAVIDKKSGLLRIEAVGHK